MVGLEDLKAKINRFYSKKIVIGTIGGDVFIYIYIYISFEFDYKSHSCCYSVFPFFIWIPPPQCILSLLYCLHSFISTLHV